MKDFEQMLEKYAELVVKVGVNVQPGQVLMVHAPLETAELTRLIVGKAYDAGAKYVLVDWDDEAVTRIRYEKAPEESFGYYPQWHADMLEGFAEEGGAILHIKCRTRNYSAGLIRPRCPLPLKRLRLRARSTRPTPGTAESAGR